MRRVLLLISGFLAFLGSESNAQTQQVEFTFTNGSFTSKIFFLFVEQGELGIDAYDGLHLTSLSGTYAEMYSRDTLGRNLTINTLPNSLSQILDQSIFTNTTFSDTFTLSVSKFENIPLNWSFELKDIQQDSTFTLSDGTSYTFLVSTGTIDRFNFTINPGIISEMVTVSGTPGKDGWRFLGSPIKDQTFKEFFSSIWTQGAVESNAPEASPNVFTWNESAQSFSPITNFSDSIMQGKGFLVYLFEDDDPLLSGVQTGWPKTFSNSGFFGFGDINLPVSYTEGDSTALNGFNLVSNPYPVAIDWESIGWTKTNIQDAIWIWDPSLNTGNGDYKVFSEGVGDDISKIAPNQAFWVRTTAANPMLSVTENDKTSGAILLKRIQQPTHIVLNVKNETFLDKHYFAFREDAHIGNDKYDVQKLPLFSSEFLRLYSIVDKKEIQINSLPGDFNEVEIPIEVHTTFRTEVVLSLEQFLVTNNELELFLFDPLQNQSFKLNEDQHFSFTPETDTTSFSVILKRKSLTSNENESDLSTSVRLFQNYPNPFNPSTIISFELPQAERVSLQVFDIMGREIASLVKNEIKSAGLHEVVYDASDLPSGLYMYRISTNKNTVTKTFTLIK